MPYSVWLCVAILFPTLLQSCMEVDRVSGSKHNIPYRVFHLPPESGKGKQRQYYLYAGGDKAEFKFCLRAYLKGKPNLGG